MNANDSEKNVALEAQTVNYYKQFALLDPSDDVCRGQVLPLNNKMDNKISSITTDSSLSEVQTITLSKSNSAATYHITY